MLPELFEIERGRGEERRRNNCGRLRSCLIFVRLEEVARWP